MIPSRPLSIGEIFAQTFLILGKTYPRYLLISLVLILPGVLLTTEGVIQLSTHAVSLAQHEGGFTDQDLLSLRNRFRDKLAEDNPAFRSEIEDANEQDTSRTRAVADSIGAQPEHARFHAVTFLEEHYTELTSEFALILSGIFLLMIGAMILASSLIDLSCQAFEERALNLGRALRDTLRRHFWQFLLLIILYTILRIFQSLLVQGFNYLPDVVAAFLSLIVFAVEFYVLVRCTVVVPALVSEELTFWNALKRSWQLTSGRLSQNWLRIFGIIFLFGLCQLGLWAIILLVCSFFVGGSAIAWWTDFLRSATVTIPALVSGFNSFVTAISILFTIPIVLLFPLSPVLTTILYYDLRTRQDGPLDYSDDYYADQEPESGPAMWQP